MMNSARLRTVWINPWSLAKRFAVREGRRGVPGGGIAPAPGQVLLREVGNADQARRGAAWYAKEPKLAGACHKTSRVADLASLKTQTAQEKVGRRARLIEIFHGRAEVIKNGLHRGLGHGAYFLALVAFALIETNLNLGALALLGETSLQQLYALGLGLAQLLLARAIGKGLKDRETGAPGAPSKGWLAGLGFTAFWMLVGLAVLRAEALHILLRVAVSETGANATGSATAVSSSPIDLPATSWAWYFCLQAAVFLAATACARLHANWLADERDHLVRAYRRRGWYLSWRLFWEARAAAKSDQAIGRWGGAFARKLEEADEATSLNMATQSRYMHHNLMSRDGELDGALRLEPLPLAEKEWKEAPGPTDRIGHVSYPSAAPLWKGFSVPAPRINPPTSNGHGELGVTALLSDSKED